MSNHISTVRQHLLDTLTDLRDREKPMEVERARAVADVARVLVDTAKVEVDYLRVTNQDRSGFLEEPSDPTPPVLPNGSSPFPTGITGVTRHRLQG